MNPSKRRLFLAKMFKEAMRPYEIPGEQWTKDEKEFLPEFIGLLKRASLILDLAGGYGRITPYLRENENKVVIADLSIHSLRKAKNNLDRTVDIVRASMLNLPFKDRVFDGIWFTQAFEYVPPDLRTTFLMSLNRASRKGGIIFLNLAKVPNEVSFLSYLRNYFYWKLLKREPVVFGDYIYKLELEHYKGWHYHSVVFTRRIEKTFKKTNLRILKAKSFRDDYPLVYLLQVQ